MSRLTARFLFITCLLLIAASCSSPRKGVSGYPQGETLQWKDLSLPISVNIKSPVAFKVNGVMTMVNGQDILISLRMFGFEVGAAYVTSDSVFAYAKLQKVYVAESIGRLLDGVDVTVSDVQAMLIGAPFRLPKLSGNTLLEEVTDKTTGRLTDLIVTHPSGRSLTLSYSPLADTPLASAISIHALIPLRDDSNLDALKELSMTISYGWDDARSDAGVSRSFTIPKGYRRINASSLLKSLN